MGRLLTTRRTQWLPGVALLGVAIGLGSFLGFGRIWALLCGLAAGVLVTSWLRGRLRAHSQPPRAGERLRLIRGGGDREDYDLARDDSTDEQPWPM